MSLHINRFVDRVRSAESRGQREIVLSLMDAKELHADITKLLLALQVLHEQQAPKNGDNTSTEIEVDGGRF